MVELQAGDYVSFDMPNDAKRGRGFVLRHHTTGELTVFEEESRTTFDKMPDDVKKLKKQKSPNEQIARLIEATGKIAERKFADVAEVGEGEGKGTGKGKAKGRPQVTFGADVRAAITDMYREMNWAMHTQKWEEVDDLLTGLDTGANQAVLVGALRCTFLVRGRVTKWFETRDNVKAELEGRELDTPVEDLMRGLLDIEE